MDSVVAVEIRKVSKPQAVRALEITPEGTRLIKFDDRRTMDIALGIGPARPWRARGKAAGQRY
jgi:hypothetical protein